VWGLCFYRPKSLFVCELTQASKEGGTADIAVPIQIPVVLPIELPMGLR
jgi:hypothetical protein